MNVGRMCRLFVLCAALAGGALGCPSTHRSSALLIERLIDTQTVMEVFPQKVHMDWRFARTDEVQSFIAEYVFERHQPNEHYSLEVSIAPAGRFLDPVRYEARRAVVQETGGGIQSEFPAIGLRAQWELFGVGPGGSSYGLTFTTQDSQYDVRIVVSELLPETVAEPDINLEVFAQRLEARYVAGFVKSKQGL